MLGSFCRCRNGSPPTTLVPEAMLTFCPGVGVCANDGEQRTHRTASGTQQDFIRDSPGARYLPRGNELGLANDPTERGSAISSWNSYIDRKNVNSKQKASPDVVWADRSNCRQLP